MAIGLITSPTQWLLRLVPTPAWFQTIQDNSNWLYNVFLAATRSAHSLYIDGTGNQTVTGVAGTVRVSAAAGSTSTPTTAITAQCLYKEMVPNAMCYVNSGGTLQCGINIASVSKTGTGTYDVTLTNGVASTTRLVLLGTALIAAGCVITATPSSTTLINVATINTSGAATDTGFFLLVYSV